VVSGGGDEDCGGGGGSVSSDMLDTGRLSIMLLDSGPSAGSNEIPGGGGVAADVAGVSATGRLSGGEGGLSSARLHSTASSRRRRSSRLGGGFAVAGTTAVGFGVD
jgi:hypothetical protein